MHDQGVKFGKGGIKAQVELRIVAGGRTAQRTALDGNTGYLIRRGIFRIAVSIKIPFKALAPNSIDFGGFGNSRSIRQNLGRVGRSRPTVEDKAVVARRSDRRIQPVAGIFQNNFTLLICVIGNLNSFRFFPDCVER